MDSWSNSSWATRSSRKLSEALGVIDVAKNIAGLHISGHGSFPSRGRRNLAAHSRPDRGQERHGPRRLAGVAGSPDPVHEREGGCRWVRGPGPFGARGEDRWCAAAPAPSQAGAVAISSGAEARAQVTIGTRL